MRQNGTDMTDDNRALKVFLCHAHSDKDAVRTLYARLKREGVDVWLDKEKLLPGADWEFEIRKAVREADVVVVCLSKQFNQAGFRQKEVRIALDAAMEKPEGEIFIIPARLEECDSLESLNRWHWVDLFERDGFQRLLLALRLRANKIGATLQQRGRATVARPKAGAAGVGQASSLTPPNAEELEKQKAADAARIAREKAEQELAEKARLEAEEAEKRRLAREIAEQADREAIEKIAREKAEKEAAERTRLEAEEAEKRRLAKIQADREAADKIAREKARLEAEEAERQRLAAASQKIGEEETSEAPKSGETSEVWNSPEKAERRKTTSKPNTAFIFWGAGLVGIILIAIISSLWGDLFVPASTQTPTYQSPTLAPHASAGVTNTPAPTKTPTKFFTPTATALPDEITDNGVPMRLVPAGEFTMGSENGSSDEKPVHTVYLDAFYMDKYEVTNALYKACEEAGGCTPPKDTSSYTRSSYYGNSEFDDYPVIYVDWNQAKAYCEWRGPSTGSGYTHLPTEAQWEKAARGADGRTYPWGEGIDCDKANYSGCKGDTTPVGSYESGQSPYGIYDLAGNVWEWTADWYSETYYQNSPTENPLGPDTGQYRVLRGGAWNNSDYYVRSSDRGNNSPVIIDNFVGFRCARSLP
jgi:formylglycine-generating enzyme required for sulfatase activity